MCGYCSEQIVFDLIRSAPPDLASSFAKLAVFEAEMLVQEVSDLDTLEIVADEAF